MLEHRSGSQLVELVVLQHAEESAFVWAQRTMLTVAPHASLEVLLRFDGRLAAHLDGLGVAGDSAWPFCDALLQTRSTGAVFATAVRAILERDLARIGQLLEITEADRPYARELLGALEWLEPSQLQGLVAALLGSEHPFRRMVGVSACALHGVDPGFSSSRWIRDRVSAVRARALRATGELGRRDLLSSSTTAVHDDDPECRFWAAWSSVLLGDRNNALDYLSRLGVGCADGDSLRAYSLSLQTHSVTSAHRIVQQIASNREQSRWVIRGSGLVGDPAYISWLIGRMARPETARVAAEAFMTITGLDLFQGFELPRPEGFEGGPSEDPNDEDVALDPDEGLPWPDCEKVEAWWKDHAHRFQPGTRYFMGAPVSREHCIQVLKTGYQRQRILAAHYLCLLNPGTPLFNTSAPAWRQQRLLAQMT